MDELRAELAEVEEMQRNMAELLNIEENVEDEDVEDVEGQKAGGELREPKEPRSEQLEPSEKPGGEADTARYQLALETDAMEADLVETYPVVDGESFGEAQASKSPSEGEKGERTSGDFGADLGKSQHFEAELEHLEPPLAPETCGSEEETVTLAGSEELQESLPIFSLNTSKHIKTIQNTIF